jgi:DNA/RNA-binding domain of Phe-tRNA-synthetase-like protein
MLIAMKDVIAARTIDFRSSQILLVRSGDHQPAARSQQVTDSFEKRTNVALIQMLDNLNRDDTREALTSLTDLGNQGRALKTRHTLISLVRNLNRLGRKIRRPNTASLSRKVSRQESQSATIVEYRTISASQPWRQSRRNAVTKRVGKVLVRTLGLPTPEAGDRLVIPR